MNEKQPELTEEELAQELGKPGTLAQPSQEVQYIDGFKRHLSGSSVWMIVNKRVVSMRHVCYLGHKL